MIKNEESLDETLVEDSQNLHEVLDNSDVQNMYVGMAYRGSRLTSCWPFRSPMPTGVEAGEI